MALQARGPITVESVATQQQHDVSVQVKKKGFLSGGGLGFTIGTEKRKDAYQTRDVLNAGSTVGSVSGKVRIASGQDVHVKGSDVIAGQDIAITGKNVTVANADDVYQAGEQHEYKRSGLTVSAGGDYIEAADTVAQSVNRAGEVKDKTLAALYAVKAAKDGADIGKRIRNSQGGTKAFGGANAFNVKIGFGTTQSKSESAATGVIAKESSVVAQGDVNITATRGDLDLTGSTVAGKDITLQASEQIDVAAAKNESVMQQHSRSSRTGAGVTLNTAGGVGKGKVEANGTTYTNSRVTATDTLTVVSGKDVTVKGGVLRGDKVNAAIGGNLNLESLQDLHAYQEKNTSAGVSLSTTPGGGRPGLAGSAYASKLDSRYQSVTEQSGIQAGEQGFAITVQGNTDLKGAVIDSQAAPEENRLTTGTLTVSDMETRKCPPPRR